VTGQLTEGRASTQCGVADEAAATVAISVMKYRYLAARRGSSALTRDQYRRLFGAWRNVTSVAVGNKYMTIVSAVISNRGGNGENILPYCSIVKHHP